MWVSFAWKLKLGQRSACLGGAWLRDACLHLVAASCCVLLRLAASSRINSGMGQVFAKTQGGWLPRLATHLA
jgi:hypothetical protein